MASSDRARDSGALSLVSTFLDSFPPSARPTHERQLASLHRVREDGELTVRVAEEGKDLVIRASGELDIASAQRFEEELGRAMDSGASVVLNLEGLTFIDSTGLRALIRAAQRSRSDGRRLRIGHGSEEFQRLVEVSGVADSLPLDD